MKPLLRWSLLLAGLALFAWFVQRAGPGEIWSHVRGLGWLAPVVLAPYFLVYLLDTLGWWVAFGAYAPGRAGYWTLFWARWAGESVNNVIPSAYIGGEAVKAYLLHRRGVPGLAAGASVVASKTCQVLAQVVFIALGALAALPHLEPGSSGRLGMITITIAAFGVVTLLFWIQRRGLFSGLQSILGALSIRIAALESRRDQWRELDDQVFRFYRQDQRRFFRCTAVYLAGWFTDAIEVYVVCALIGQPLSWSEAVAIEAFITVAKAMGIFVPAAIGVQESGVVLLFHLMGLPAPVGAAYALIRRGRDLVYVLVGGTVLYGQQVTLRELAVESKSNLDPGPGRSGPMPDPKKPRERT